MKLIPYIRAALVATFALTAAGAYAAIIKGNVTDNEGVPVTVSPATTA